MFRDYIISTKHNSTQSTTGSSTIPSITTPAYQRQTTIECFQVRDCMGENISIFKRIINNIIDFSYYFMAIVSC